MHCRCVHYIIWRSGLPKAPKGAFYLSNSESERVMDRMAIFVDAGYFFAAGAEAAAGVPTPRKAVSLKNPGAMLKSLVQKAAEAASNKSLLRTYWYDAMPGSRPSLEQTALAHLSGMKVRFGVLNSKGQQKGVDSLIVTDLIDLARNRAIADAVLVSGDEDLRIAVEIAQTFGVRVHIMAAGSAAKNVSPDLKMEADSVTELDAIWFKQHLAFDQAVVKAGQGSPPEKTKATTLSEVAPGPLGQIAEQVAAELLAEHDEPRIQSLRLHFETSTAVPPEFDRPLIARVSAALSGQRLSGDESRHIRGIFVRLVKQR